MFCFLKTMIFLKYKNIILTETWEARLKFGPGDLFLPDPVEFAVAVWPDCEPFLLRLLFGAL